MIRIPDPIELGELNAERWADENIRGDQFRCACCEDWFPLDIAMQATPNPFSPAVCPECAGVD